MTPIDIERLISTLGFPTALIILIGLFVYRTFWPWFMNQFEWWKAAIERSTKTIEQVLSAMNVVADQIKAQPNIQIAELLTRLIERNDLHHTDARISFADLRERLDRIEKEIPK